MDLEVCEMGDTIDLEEFQDNFSKNYTVEDYIMRYYIGDREIMVNGKDVSKKRIKKRKVSQ
jgi:hypothetical protein